MQTLHRAPGVSLDPLLELERLIFALELQHLDLILLLAHCRRQRLVASLLLELPSELAFMQLLRLGVEGHQLRRRFLIGRQLGYLRDPARLLRGWSEHARHDAACRLLESVLEFLQLLLALQQAAIDRVLRRGLGRRGCKPHCEEPCQHVSEADHRADRR